MIYSEKDQQLRQHGQSNIERGGERNGRLPILLVEISPANSGEKEMQLYFSLTELTIEPLFLKWWRHPQVVPVLVFVALSHIPCRNFSNALYQ